MHSTPGYTFRDDSCRDCPCCQSNEYSFWKMSVNNGKASCLRADRPMVYIYCRLALASPTKPFVHRIQTLQKSYRGLSGWAKPLTITVKSDPCPLRGPIPGGARGALINVQTQCSLKVLEIFYDTELLLGTTKKTVKEVIQPHLLKSENSN